MRRSLKPKAVKLTIERVNAYRNCLGVVLRLVGVGDGLQVHADIRLRISESAWYFENEIGLRDILGKLPCKPGCSKIHEKSNPSRLAVKKARQRQKDGDCWNQPVNGLHQWLALTAVNSRVLEPSELQW